MLKHWLPAALAALLGFVMLAGCTSSGLDALFGTYTIDATGGTVTASGGQVKLVVPSGAVSGPVILTVGITTDAPDGLVPGAAYSITAVGAEVFVQPVQLTVSYTAASATGFNTDSFKLYRKEDTEQGPQWVQLANCVHNASQRTVSTEITEFGTYAILGSSL